MIHKRTYENVWISRLGYVPPIERQNLVIASACDPYNNKKGGGFV